MLFFPEPHAAREPQFGHVWSFSIECDEKWHPYCTGKDFEEAVIYFEAFSWDLLTEAEENHENLRQDSR
jgi:hypothetical protein